MSACEDRFDRWKVGDQVKLKHIITEKDMSDFVQLTGDNNPIHTDETYAENTPFGQRVVHGMLSASFISTIIGTKIPGEGALWLSQTINFISPARISDEITISASVKSISRSQRVLILDISIKNQNNLEIISGESKVKVVQQFKKERKLDHEKKAAIITGASKGIGAAIALRLSKDGYPVIINYLHSKEKAEKIVFNIKNDGGSAIAVQANVAREDDVKKMVEVAVSEFSGVDVLVNNASGAIVNKSFFDLSWDDVSSHFSTQVRGTFNSCKEVIPLMVQQGHGRIINISSIYTDSTPPVKTYDYILAKSALSSLTKSLAVEYGPKGINVNNVAPGMTETTLISNIPERTKMVTSMQAPLRRLAGVDDVANVVSALVGDAGNYITGETIRVCGGQVML